MKFAVREAVDVYFKAKSVMKLGARTIRAGEPVLIFDTVKTSTMEVGSEVSYLTGGRGNARLLSYEGDKTLSFNFSDALFSAEGLAILSGADIIPARNADLPGAPSEARSVIAHFTEKVVITAENRVDTDTSNVFPTDPAIGGIPQGGILNVPLTNKPFVGLNSSIYVMLLDEAGEMSGAPVEINLNNDATDNKKSFLSKFIAGDKFVAFDTNGLPMSVANYSMPTTKAEAGIFQDMAGSFVEIASATENWIAGNGDIANFTREIPTGTVSGVADYGFLINQPKAYLDGSQKVYKVNVPSMLKGDVVLIDYYVEHKHDATEIQILPDKFPGFFYVEGSSLFRRASDGMDLPVEFVIPKFKPTTSLNLTMQSTGDPSTLDFSGDAYPDFTKFNPTKKVLSSIMILGADDNYDALGGGSDTGSGDPTSYRRFQYNEDEDGAYIWKDQSLAAHANIDYSDTGDYVPDHGGPATQTPGDGLIDS